jgi:hypothetical protein
VVSGAISSEDDIQRRLLEIYSFYGQLTKILCYYSLTWISRIALAGASIVFLITISVFEGFLICFYIYILSLSIW